MRRKLSQVFAYSFMGLMLASCASRVPPNGGAKDTEAPVIVSSEPDSAALNFQGKKVRFTFDEFIDLKDGGTGIVISPPITTPPNYLVKGKTLEITFEEKLDSATTYSIILGKSITDISENNPFPTKTFAFSTGPVIDSLQMSGNVTDAYTNKAVKDAVVMLYPTLDDSLPYKKLPRYFARTDASGNYQIEAIRAGEYLAFALSDANSNFLYDQPDEQIGFLANPIRIDSNKTSGISFRMSPEKAKRQRLIKKEFELPGKITLKYALPVESLELKDYSGNAQTIYPEFNIDRDSIVLWLKPAQTDSLNLICISKSLGQEKIDTLNYLPGQLRRKATVKKRNTSKVDTLLHFTNNLETGKIRPTEQVVLISNHPSKLKNRDRIYWVIGKDTTKAQFVESVDSITFKTQVKVPSVLGSKAVLVMMPGAFEDIFSIQNDTTKTAVNRFVEDDLGLLDFRIKSADSTSTFILELFTSKGKKLYSKQVKPGTPVVIEGLVPGSYSARIIEDLDQDGSWSKGRFSDRKQPERIRPYLGEITIRAGWDLELEWDLNAEKKLSVK